MQNRICKGHYYLCYELYPSKMGISAAKRFLILQFTIEFIFFSNTTPYNLLLSTSSCKIETKFVLSVGLFLFWRLRGLSHASIFCSWFNYYKSNLGPTPNPPQHFPLRQELWARKIFLSKNSNIFFICLLRNHYWKDMILSRMLTLRK